MTVSVQPLARGGESCAIHALMGRLLWRQVRVKDDRVAKSKSITTVEPEADEPVVAETDELPPESLEPSEAAPGVVRKPLGAKEVIPFKWKLVGRGGDLVVTLFKSVEREDVEAQFERLSREGYYADLQILDINAKVEQPKPTKSVARANKARGAEKSAKAAKEKSAAGKGKDKAARSRGPIRIPALKSTSKKKASPVKAARSARKTSRKKK